MNRHRTRNWCFTLNNYTEQELNFFKSPITGIRYLVCGLESGKNETPHLQGFLQTSDAHDMSWLKNNLSSRAHWEMAKGSVEDNIRYCTKEGNHYNWGSAINTQGTRTDIIQCTEKINAGVPLSLIAIAHPLEYVKYHSGLEKYKRVTTKKDHREPLRVVVHIGVTGSGKSYNARFENAMEPNYVLPHPTNALNPTTWFDGYIYL